MSRPKSPQEDRMKRERVTTRSLARAQRARTRIRNTNVRRCRECGCSDDDCRQCIERTGRPCHWVDADLCSACVAMELSPGPAVLPLQHSAGGAFGGGR